MKLINYQGFTLIESLYGLVVLIMVLSFFQPFIRYFGIYQDQSANEALLEWQTFSNQLDYELSEAELLASSATTIDYCVDKDKIFVIEKYNNQIRKRTATVGHQPILLNVADWKITRVSPQQLYIEVIFLDGTLRSGYQTFKRVMEVRDEADN